MISLLFAASRNNVIGYQNKMPWHLPQDLKFFKEKTTGNTIIMGRKTLESMNGPLPNRRNVVLTRNKDLEIGNVEIIHDLSTVERWNKEHPEIEYFIIGGGAIYEQAVPIADRMYITRIDEEFPGDTFAPAFTEAEWKLTKKEKGIKNDKNPYDYYFLQYDRKN
ncbi:dihydrofolate reductase [Oceanobacillus neutriphilus]|uniref:Dihydrofolate reductase n=2 Tax=Oceanobacillus neutriphilus TaxID=531815 RepID=A0ABQ2NU25_9BACI|nr:dihydrofolate reductase [Oceanobacillus neutriphilus]GGP10565.1 dihydrofolate reductase [Oceanobacillus neutriphilus]